MSCWTNGHSQIKFGVPLRQGTLCPFDALCAVMHVSSNDFYKCFRLEVLQSDAGKWQVGSMDNWECNSQHRDQHRYASRTRYDNWSCVVSAVSRNERSLPKIINRKHTETPLSIKMQLQLRHIDGHRCWWTRTRRWALTKPEVTKLALIDPWKIAWKLLAQISHSSRRRPTKFAA